jgi:hypothetical protein
MSYRRMLTNNRRTNRLEHTNIESTDHVEGRAIAQAVFFFIWFVRLLALRPLLAYCASLG